MEGIEKVESKECYMAGYARDGLPSSDHLKIRTVTLSLDLDSIPDDHVAIQSLWISVDPYLRSRMTGIAEDGLNVSQFPINQAIGSYGAGKIIRSKSEKYKEGDIVICPEMPIAEYSIVPTKAVAIKVDPAFGVDPVDYLSVLGVPGFAAWIGIEVIGKAKEGENVFISAAAGGVGMVAGQLAKLKGCYVVGSCGSDDKVKLLKEEFGYDEVINYKKEPDLDAALTKYFPNGIDIYFENVGGKTLEAVLNHVNGFARIPLCGMISQYNKVWTEREGVRNLLNMVGKEVHMQGFMLRSYMNRFVDFITEMGGYLKDKKITSKLKINKGIESFPESLASLFTSSNIGKVVIEV
ncbi:2-alkenal reductase (NADP(+)-dependent)-like [Amaranthus tricolor]|uniref:2-alkenal reductase (NADP(+)-dependent)-like n=1 Tax=Amaranthus tricolor TaxID=29722 RepID=UPI0025911B50|nr:2-alkenal reductase (NADP(+)-dependent)-like [Amaranthus tricolor]